jgi:cob(I)alamin adenosyltransferase
VKIYTKKGDRGMSVLLDGRRVPKNHLRLETYGTLDELNSHMGLAAAQCPHAELKAQIKKIQDSVFVLGADLATPLASPKTPRMRRIGAKDVAALERQIDEAAAQLPPLKRFIIPGGGVTSARLHVARTVCRRAERHLAALMQDTSDPVGEEPLIFVNRLGDLLFVLARLANKLDDIADLEWNIQNPA